MSRGPIVTSALFDHVKEILTEVPQKDGETADQYADRLNKKYNKMKPLSADTYRRIRKSNTIEEYRDVIRKKHPPKNTQKTERNDELSQLIDHLQKALNIAISINIRRSHDKDDDDDEYLKKIYETFGTDVQEVS